MARGRSGGPSGIAMKFVIDMNLSPLWVKVFENEGWKASHWSTIGAMNATDEEILRWASKNEHIVFTHDLDFGAILAATQAKSPSVIQVRTQDITPESLQDLLVTAVRQHEAILKTGALIIVDEYKLRARILPIRR